MIRHHARLTTFASRLLVGFTGCLLALTGCASYQKIELPEVDELPDFPLVKADAPIKLKPGDEIEIRFVSFPEFNDIQTIRADGMITLPRVDEIKAADLSPTELDAKLTELYSEKVRQPELSVIVRSIAEQRVFIGGEVMEPGPIEMPGRMSALEAIMAGGGFNKASADSSKIIVIRTYENKRYAALVNLKKTLYQTEGTGPFYLAPMDIVLVPPTTIDKYNQWVDQYINKILPVGLTASHPLGAEGTWGLDLSRGGSR